MGSKRGFEVSMLDELQQEAARERQEQAREAEGSDFHSETYRYFQFDHFLEGLHVAKQTYQAARQIIDSGGCKPISMTYGYDRNMYGDELLGQAVLEYNGKSWMDEWTAGVTFNSTRIVYRCRHYSDNQSYLKYKVCEHEVAALLLAMNELEQTNPGDTTSTNAIALMKSMRRTEDEGGYGLLDAGRQEMIELEPSVTVQYPDQLYLSFRIGTRRKYKAKDLPQLVDAVRQHKEMQFGNTTRLLMGREYFSEASLPWLDFIEQAVDEDEEELRRIRKRMADSGGYYSYGYQPALKKIEAMIYLNGALLDRFCEIVLSEQKPVEIVQNGYKGKSKETLSITDAALPVTLEIKKDEDPATGVVHGIRLTGSVPSITMGRRFGYTFEFPVLGRISEERTQEIKPLRDMADSSGVISLRVGRSRLPEFYRKVLPRLREIAQVNECDIEEILSYIPPEPSFVCFLDLENDVVFCRAQVYYGNHEFSLSDLVRSSGSGVEAFRDTESEKAVLETITQYLSEYEPSLQVFYCMRDDENLFAFLNAGLDELMELAEVRATDRFKRLRIRRRLNLTVGVSIESSLMDLNITSTDLSEEELLDVLFGYKKKRRFVRLKSGDFIRLDTEDSVYQLSQMMEAMHISPKQFVQGKMQIPAYRALYLDKMLELSQDIYANRDQHFKTLIKEFKTVEDADYEVPASLKETMRRYQIAGYQWLRTLDHYGFGGILADDMGLGKTLQMIAVLLGVSESEEEEMHGPSLVVCPASLVYNWGEELARFAPSLKVLLVVGTQGERKTRLKNWDSYDVLVTSYDLLKRDILEYDGKQFRFEVVDEAQYIKTHTTAAAKTVKLIKAKTKFALTGTPIENRLSELWSIFDYLMPGFLYEYETFRSNLELPITKHQEEEASERLRRMVAPFILRRLKKDVLKDLPDKLEEIRYAVMDKKQQKLYDGQVVLMKKELRDQTDDDFRKNKIQVLAELMRIRQICCDPSLCFEGYGGGSAKRESCLELIQSLVDSGHKALLFSQFTSMLQLLQEDLDKAGIRYYTITGSTPKEKRAAMVSSFNSDDTPLFLISLKAGGTGLNLVGADVVIHYDPWWNLAVQNQATDRAHRIGQTNIVTVFKLIMKGTIEEKIVQIQESKRKLAEDILSADGIGSSTLSREDLMELLD